MQTSPGKGKVGQIEKRKSQKKSQEVKEKKEFMQWRERSLASKRLGPACSKPKNNQGRGKVGEQLGGKGWLVWCRAGRVTK